MGILIPIILIVLTSIVIWKSSDGFDVASSYLGRNLSNGVKGATIKPMIVANIVILAKPLPLFLIKAFHEA